MDWIRFEIDLPQSQTLSTPRVTPSSPSCGCAEDPGFSIKRVRKTVRGLQADAALPVLPPSLRFPGPMTPWTA